LKTLTPSLRNMRVSELQKPFCLYCQAKHSLLSVRVLQNSHEVFREKSGESLVSSQLAQSSHYVLKGLLLSFEDRVDMRFCSFLSRLDRLGVAFSVVRGPHVKRAIA
jgi:hypothetical protein